MDMRDFIIIAVLILLLLAGAYVYPMLPDAVASHWGVNGEVNGHMSKFWGVFLIPALAVAMYLLFIAIPYIAPNKKTILQFRHYFTLKLSIILFLAAVYVYTLLFNLGYQFNINRLMPALLGALFIVIGFVIKDIKKNYFIGIRTPWTLASELVWKKTHLFGSKTFAMAGLVCFTALFQPQYAFYIIITAVILAALVPVVYSYLEFRKIKK